MGKQSKSIVAGMTVLGLAGIICKLVGVLFSIPLTWIIGADGLGVFQAVFPTYNLLLTISSAGLPVAVSRMVSHALAHDDPRSAKKIFRIALCLLTALGCICTLLMLCGSPLLADHVNQPEAQLGFQVIAPCVAVVCVLSAFRGFMQGQQNMVPTAISQLIEQVGKVFISLPLAYFGAQISIAHGAAGALLGITIVEFVALVYMIMLYLRRRYVFSQIPQLSTEEESSGKGIARQLMLISIPITISACIVPLSQTIDSSMLIERMLSTGMTIEQARPVYGLFSGLVIRLINVPTALALAVSMSLVPAISAARALDDYDTVARQSDLGLRFAFLIGFPCSIGMSFLSREIVSFFYAETLSPEHLTIASELLSVSSLTVVLFTVVQATSSILQGLNYQRIPMYTLIAGVVCKIALNYILVGTPEIGIHGAPIASLVCYTVSLVPNLYFVLKFGKVRMNWMGWIVRPGIATAAMGAVVLLMRHILPQHRLITLVEVAVGVVVFVAAALEVKAVTPDDLRSLRRRKKGANA
ncbi:MAG: polysaccharide biosynthesis protein [Clostridiales bacterium]|nr:polysaccharide biosynthesis protein [Clostridiales bacterium]